MLSHAEPYPGMEQETLALIPADFLRTTPYAQWRHLARFLKAKRLRAERFKQNPIKDDERAALLIPFARRATLRGRADPLYWLVEEYRVSVFAQELGTAESVSDVKLERLFAAALQPREADSEVRPPAVRETPAAAPVQKPQAPKKKVSLKSLGGLDTLLR
jgi:ATP-dependent helicase HrpA